MGTEPRWNNQLRGKALKQPNLATNVASLALGRMIQSQNMNNLSAEKQLPCSLDKGAKASAPLGPEWQRGAVAVCSTIQFNTLCALLFNHTETGANSEGFCFWIPNVSCNNPWQFSCKCLFLLLPLAKLFNVCPVYGSFNVWWSNHVLSEMFFFLGKMCGWRNKRNDHRVLKLRLATNWLTGDLWGTQLNKPLAPCWWTRTFFF